MKLNRVAKVELVFENCEEISVPISDIERLYVYGLTESLGFFGVSHDVHRYKSAQYFRIIFENKPEYKRVFKHKDIAQVHLYDADGNEEWFFVAWGAGDHENELQATKLDKFGKINITIAEELNSIAGRFGDEEYVNKVEEIKRRLAEVSSD